MSLIPWMSSKKIEPQILTFSGFESLELQNDKTPYNTLSFIRLPEELLLTREWLVLAKEGSLSCQEILNTNKNFGQILADIVSLGVADKMPLMLAQTFAGLHVKVVITEPPNPPGAFGMWGDKISDVVNNLNPQSRIGLAFDASFFPNMTHALATMQDFSLRLFQQAKVQHLSWYIKDYPYAQLVNLGHGIRLILEKQSDIKLVLLS